MNKPLLTIVMIVSLLSPAWAQETQQPTTKEKAELTDEQRLEKLVFLNENGSISISYEVPWSFEYPDYATSLGTLLRSELVMAYSECQSLKDDLDSVAQPPLGPTTQAIIESMESYGSTTQAGLLTSLLTKYALKNPIDAETPHNTGKYKMLNAKFCTNAQITDPGLMEQMFMSPMHPESIGGTVWNVRTCDNIEIVRKCVQAVSNQNRQNQAASGNEASTAVELDISTRFSRIQTRPAH